MNNFTDLVFIQKDSIVIHEMFLLVVFCFRREPRIDSLTLNSCTSGKDF